MYIYNLSFRIIDDTFRLSKCVQIARLYLEVLNFSCMYRICDELINSQQLGSHWTSVDIV